MADRITRADVDHYAGLVSSAIPAGLDVVPESRYGYIGLDLCDSAGAVRTLATGLTKRQAYDYLRAMLEMADLQRKES